MSARHLRSDAGNSVGAAGICRFSALESSCREGKASTGIVVYSALLWPYDLLSPLEDIADPVRDKEGLALEAGQGASGSARAERSTMISNATQKTAEECFVYVEAVAAVVEFAAILRDAQLRCAPQDED